MAWLCANMYIHTYVCTIRLLLLKTVIRKVLTPRDISFGGGNIENFPDLQTDIYSYVDIKTLRLRIELRKIFRESPQVFSELINMLQIFRPVCNNATMNI